MTNHPDSENSWGASRASVNTPRNLTYLSDSPRRRETTTAQILVPNTGGTNTNNDILPPGTGSNSRSNQLNKKLEMTPFLNEWIPNERTTNNTSNDKKNLEISELIATKVKNDKTPKRGFGSPLDVDIDIDIENPMLCHDKDNKDLCPSDKEIFKEGFIYKKNSTGIFIYDSNTIKKNMIKCNCIYVFLFYHLPLLNFFRLIHISFHVFIELLDWNFILKLSP